VADGLAELVRLGDALADDELAAVDWLADGDVAVVPAALSEPEQPASTAANPSAAADNASRLRMVKPPMTATWPSARDLVGPCTDSRKIISPPVSQRSLGQPAGGQNPPVRTGAQLADGRESDSA